MSETVPLDLSVDRVRVFWMVKLLARGHCRRQKSGVLVRKLVVVQWIQHKSAESAIA